MTSRGQCFACDIAVVGIGVEPEIDFLAGSGIPTDNGVVVDEHCRSAVEAIYAAGGCCQPLPPLLAEADARRALAQRPSPGAAAARSMLGRPEPDDPVHWYWSDQYDFNLQYAGVRLLGDRIVVRGSLDSRKFLAFHVGGGRLNAAVSSNRAKDLRRVMPLIKTRPLVDARQFEDEGVALRSLLHTAG